MKKVLFLLGIGLVFGLGSLNAQCAKSKGACCKSKGTASTEIAPVGIVSTSAVSAAALVAAANDATIEKRVCEHSGNVSFHKKSVDAATGAVSYSEVVYDNAKAQFVSLASESDVKVGDKKAGCASGTGKSCCKKGQKSCSKGEANATPAMQENVAPAPAKVQ